MMRLVSQVMVAPLLVGGPRRYVVTLMYGIAGVLAGLLWLLVPVALWRSFGEASTLLWLLPTTIAIFAVTTKTRPEEDLSDYTVTVVEDEPEEPEMPAGFQDWLTEVMQPPPRWYRVSQYVAIALFSLIFAVAALEQWFLWMLVMVQIFDPWAIIVGVTIAAIQMLRIFSDKPFVR